MSGDPNKIKVVHEFGRRDILFAVAHDPQKQRLFVGSSDAKVYDTDPGSEKFELTEIGGHGSYVMGVISTGDHLVSGSYDGRLKWWDIEARKEVRSIEAHQKWIRGVWLSPDRKTLVSVADDMVCRLWDAESGEMLRELRGHAERTPHHFPSMLFCAAISPDNQFLATADKVGLINIWEMATGKKLASVEAPIMYTWDPKARIHSIGGIRSLAFSPDSKLIAAGGIGTIGNIDHLGALARVEIFDWKKGERTHEFPGDQFKGLVEHLQFAPDGKWLFAAGGDHGGFYKFFDLGDSKIIKQDKAPMHVHEVAFNESFDKIYAVGHGKIVVWQM